MEPLSMASLGIGVGSSILGASLSFDQADQMRADTAERVRRFGLFAKRTQSEAEAMGNASGVTSDSGSLTKYLGEMGKEFSRQTDWMRETGDRQADMTEMAGLFGAAGGLGSNLFQFGAANNWFRSPTIR